MKHILYLLLSLYFSIIPFYSDSQVFVDWGSEWSYFKGVAEPSQPQGSWRTNSFNASTWALGNAPFQYGEGTYGTVLDDMQGNYSTLFIRKEFFLENIDEIDNLLVAVDYDDGYALWINGSLVINRNAPARLEFNQFGTIDHESGNYDITTLTIGELTLINGINVVAIQGFNYSLSSNDFYINAYLEGKKGMPVAGNVRVDTRSGFYTEVFTTQLTGTQPGDPIHYTLDGTDPRISSTALKGTSPVQVTIDPDSNLGERGKTGGVVLRASIIKTGFLPGIPTTRNYIFLKKVITQTHPGGPWPTGNINGQIIDLPMDARVTNDVRYKELMDDALLDIPTIAITTAPDNLFNPISGIYVNAKYHGRTWERPSNVELIYPDGRPGFNIDAGLRIRGGWSRHPEFPKHAFRLFFRSEYGESKLRFPLFGNDGVSTFDKIDFRTSQNYSWSKGGPEGVYNTMNRDVFSRDIQRDMGHPYTRSRYYHLYINGLYWGIYQSQERAEADFAQSYLGGISDDYDVIKVDIGENWNLYTIEATDGNTDAWEAVWSMTQKGFAANADYFNLIGRTPAGEPDPSKTVWVDIDNLIDYMLIIFYTGNFDAPVSKFSNNYNPNNFFAIFNRTRTDQGFKFIIHDAEHTLLANPVGPGVGLNENRVNIGNITFGQMNVTSFSKFHPQWLHHRLTSNREYRMRFIDRAYKHFIQNGILQPDSNVKRFKSTADQLQLAIIAESARWGDVFVSVPRTKDKDWIPAVNQVINDYFPYRTDIVLGQLLQQSLYAMLKAPVVKNAGGEVIKGTKLRIADETEITLENINTNGTIFYTFDGTDPRAVGGQTSSTAKATSSFATLKAMPGTQLKARIRWVDLWSPLHEIYFQDTSVFDYLKVTEMHYNPTDEGDLNGQELEFIELKNTGKRPIDLSGVSFTEGIQYTFATGTIVNPGDFVVLASNNEAFSGFYQMPTSHQYAGRLSNSGETITLKASTGEIIFSYSYSDKAPWPIEADGKGPSLVSVEVNPRGNPDTYEYWTLSKYKSGSPYANDEASQLIITLQHLIENQAQVVLNLDEIFDTPPGSNYYQLINDRPAYADATLLGGLLALKPLKRGDTRIHLTITPVSGAPWTTAFRVLVHPQAHQLSKGAYTFAQWQTTEPEYSYPANMLFLQSDINDPGLAHPLLFPYFVAHNDYHSNDLDKIGFPYSLTGRTRLNALGSEGISFINTGRQRDLGGAMLALDTRGITSAQVDWTAGTVLRNDRVYALRLQYRTGTQGEWRDLLINGQVQEYITQANGHSRQMGPVMLPAELLNLPNLQLLWKYYHVSGNSGSRAELRLDNIYITSTVNVDEIDTPGFIIYSAGNKLFASVNQPQNAFVKVYNLMGQEVFSAPIADSGVQAFEMQLSTGIYIARITNGFLVESRKILINSR